MLDTYLVPWKKFAEFSGRAGRTEFWTFTLINIAISIILSVLSGQIGILRILYILFSLALILPDISLSIRRLHDLDRSGWWWLIAFTGVGAIVLIIWACMPGTRGANRFGPESAAAAAA